MGDAAGVEIYARSVALYDALVREGKLQYLAELALARVRHAILVDRVSGPAAALPLRQAAADDHARLCEQFPDDRAHRLAHLQACGGVAQAYLALRQLDEALHRFQLLEGMAACPEEDGATALLKAFVIARQGDICILKKQGAAALERYETAAELMAALVSLREPRAREELVSLLQRAAAGLPMVGLADEVEGLMLAYGIVALG
jgi:hypothetical protein